MFDLADYYSMNSVMLDEHFRSLPPVINFSNREFYSDRIRVMRKDKLDENGFNRLPTWQDALSRYLKELKDNEQF